MSEFVKDGTGKGNLARVDNRNRLHVDSVQTALSAQAAFFGDAYSIPAGQVAFTSDSESGAYYIKYNGNKELVIKEIVITFGDSTGGTGTGVTRIYKNPSEGTLISSGTSIEPRNRNFGSAKALTGTFLKGAEGTTVTDGSVFATISRTDFSSPINFDAEILVLQKSNSLAVTYDPPTGNTSQTITVTCICFEKDLEILISA